MAYFFINSRNFYIIKSYSIQLNIHKQNWFSTNQNEERMKKNIHTDVVVKFRTHGIN